MVNRFSISLVVCLVVAGASVCAQNPAPMAKPESLGLRIPANRDAIEVNDRRVLVSSGEFAGSEPVVAKVYLEIGSHYVVMLPDGSLQSLPKRETTPTDRPFEAMDKDDLAEKLKREFPGFKTRATRRYLCVYNTDDGFCERKSAILETMYPLLVSFLKRQKLDVTKPDTPLIVVMFRTKKEFLKYREMPESLMAYYNGVNNRVFLYQYSDVAKDAPMIAAMQSTSMIAHEGVHQILHNVGVQKRLSDWPIWISEGLAEYFAPTSASRSKWSGVGKPNHLRMRALFEHLRETPGVGSGAMIRRLVNAESLTSTDYAIAWALTHYLATKRKSDLFAYVREVADSTPLTKRYDNMELFEKHFEDDYAKIEREMIKHIQGLPYSNPVLNQPYFLVSATTGKRRLATITSSKDHLATKKELVKKLNPQERARVRFYPVRVFPNMLTAKQAMQLFTSGGR